MEIATVVSNTGAFLTGAINWMGQLVTFIGENPLVFILAAGMPIAGFAAGLLGRLFRS